VTSGHWDKYKDNTLHKATAGEPSCKKIAG